MNLVQAFDRAANTHPAKTAIFWGADQIRYSLLAEQSVRLASHLIEKMEVRPGDRVGLWMKNRPEFVAAFFAILRAGAVVVPINSFLKSGEVEYILKDAGARVVISEESISEGIDAVETPNSGFRCLNIEELASTPNSDSTFPEPKREDLAVIIYTSGTTGKPKGAMLSHGNLLHNVESCRLVLQTVSDDRFAVILPLFHSYMLCVGMLLPLIIGGSIVLVKSLHPPRNALLEIFSGSATILPAIPPFYRSMVTAPIKPPLPLRMCISGAAPLPVQVLKDFESKFGIPLIEGYGLSEASPVVTKNPINGIRKPGSIGLPIPHVEVSIQDDEGRQLNDGEIGELCVRGGNVMLGYWNKPDETAKAIRDGWLLTGDVGYRDSEGYYYITDRKKDMLLVNGINVYPREIEEVIYEFPGIREAAVIGIPDRRKGEQPLAYVSMNEGMDLNAEELQVRLIAHLKGRLADYKLPRRIVVLPALPRNATGKIMKTALREMARKAAGQMEKSSTPA